MEAYAQTRYTELTSDREDFLEMGRRCAALTLPYLLTEDGFVSGERLKTPWQSLGAKGTNVLSSKLMLALFPINTSFFKLQINDEELLALPELTEKMRSEIDLGLAKMERTVTQQIAETSDRVMLSIAMKHLVVTGNCLIFAGKTSLKVFPLDRFVIARDGDGTVMEIVTKEIVDRSLLPKEFHNAGGLAPPDDSNAVGMDGPKFGVTTGNPNQATGDEAVVYTCVKLKDGQHHWHQECDGKVIPGSQSSSPLKHTPWMPLRFNVVQGESYGRSRVEEYIGDLTSLERLMQAMVEGSAAAAKVVFMVSPSATTKPQSLAAASNGAIIQGRPDDVGVVQVGKTADFKTVQGMIQDLTQRLSDAFLILNVRQSERTTATEVQATRQELNEQLGGIFGSLTVELLTPYLNRKLYLLQRSNVMPTLPKGLVMPTVVAGLGGVGRGQDKQALTEFVTTIGSTMGPQALMQYINPTEYIKRLAASSGIDTLNLVKTPEDIAQEQRQAEAKAMTASLVNQAGQLAKSGAAEEITQQMINAGNTEEAPASPEAGEEA